jgi:PAS domain-containing protein
MTQFVKSDTLRKFGVDFVGDVPWGTHLCQFYETKKDLISILTPYFTEGLRNNEFCMWVTSPPLEVEEAKAALEKAVPELKEYIRKGQVEVLPHTEWYLLDGEFDMGRVLQSWVEKEKTAIDRGYEGLRLSGNMYWVGSRLWRSFADYEAAVNNVITSHRMLALCTYSLEKCTGMDVVDVLKNHVGALIIKDKEWHLVEDRIRRKKTEEALVKSERGFHSLFKNMNSAFAYHKVVYDENGKPVDYIFLEVNEQFEKNMGLKRKNVLGKKVTEVIPDIGKDSTRWIEVYGRVAETGKPAQFESYSEPLGKWYSVSA